MAERSAPDAVLRLMEDPRELVPAAAIAPILGMNPQVMVKRAKTGTWPDDVCKCIVNGSRVKFFRLDFLRNGGGLAEEPPETDVMREILAELRAIREAIQKEPPAGSDR